MWLLRGGPFGVPRVIAWLLLVDVALGVAYLTDLALGQPSVHLSRLIDLDSEANLPTWFSTIQWFIAAALWAAVADRLVIRGRRRTWALWLLPVLTLAFSMDETVQLHEFVGVQSDVLLPGGTREATTLSETGLFFVVVGLPASIVIGAILAMTRRSLEGTPGAFGKLVAGMVAFLIGAIGFDFLSNFVHEKSTTSYLLIYAEETLEMVGATAVVWAALDLATDGWSRDGGSDARLGRGHSGR